MAAATVPSPTEAFFEALRRRGRDPLLAGVRGAIRFDISDEGATRRWLVTIDDGEVAVSGARRRADCVVRADRRLFDGIATGAVNATAAVLRGALEVEGDPELLLRFQRALPGRPPARVPDAGEGAR